MRKVFWIIPLLMILCASTVFAATPNFYVTYNDINKNLYLEDDMAEFNVTISNLNTFEDVFTFSTLDGNWNLIANPSQIKISAEEQKSFRLFLLPRPDLPIGIYGVNIKIKSERSGSFNSYVFTVHKKPLDFLTRDYKPSVDFSVNIDKEVDPRKKIPVEIFIKNKNSLDVGEATIMIDGTLFQDQQTVYIGPLEEKRIEYLYTINPFQKPDFYSLKVELLADEVVKSSTKNYEIAGYSSITQDSDNGKSFLFRTKETITLENLGNIEKVKKVNMEMPWIKKHFSNSEPKAIYVKTDKGRAYEWNIVMQPQEFTNIVITTNYRLPILILLIILIIITFYYVFRSPIVIMKQSVVIDSGEDVVEHLKIRVYIRNRTRKALENVAIIDRIPGIAELIKKKTLGTIQPEKVTKQDKKGTTVKWLLETLEPFEERIITYEIKSRLKIIGSVSLPSARIKFMHRNKERTVFSNRVIVSK